MTAANPATRILLDWWHAKRGPRAMPARADLDPLELKAILPQLLLIDVAVAAEPRRFVFTCRLAGTEIDSRFGVNLTGVTLDQAPFGEARAAIRQEYEAAVNEQLPVLCSHSVVVDGGRSVEYERLVAPLSGKDNAVTALAVAIDFNCVHRLESGRPSACSNLGPCDRIDLCLMRPAAPG
ncbi:PAS domain-containing protein [Dongia sp.]|uniref:PAS domain-containing protein n=1 Tax=Dongia sp. TaxID=1977262 RepID=UPI003750C3BB